MMKKKVYLDNCTYNRPFDDQRQIRIYLEAQAKLHIQSLIADNKLILSSSYMSLYENNDNPHEERRLSIMDFLGHASIFVNYDKADIIEARALKIIEKHIKIKDAIHIACALEAGCDYFITTDDNLIKNYSNNEIIICSPIDFINIWEDQDE